MTPATDSRLARSLDRIPHPVGKTLYFAYGANLHPEQMRERCFNPNVVAQARLVDHRLDFFGNNLVWDGGFETVVPDPGHAVWGVIYALSPLDIDSLDAWQDARFDGTGTYFHYPVTVVDVRGTSREVLLYKKDILGAPRKPSSAYLEHIVQGAEARGLPAGYIAGLRATAAKKASYPVPIPLQESLGGLRTTTCSDCGSLLESAPGRDRP